jgi:hypothetical protein
MIEIERKKFLIEIRISFLAKNLPGKILRADSNRKKSKLKLNFRIEISFYVEKENSVTKKSILVLFLPIIEIFQSRNEKNNFSRVLILSKKIVFFLFLFFF